MKLPVDRNGIKNYGGGGGGGLRIYMLMSHQVG